MQNLNIYLSEKLNINKDTLISINPDDISSRDDVVTYAKSLGYDFKEEKPIKNFYNKSLAFSLNYGNGLKLYIEFINRVEYFYTWSHDGEELYDLTSSMSLGDEEWDDLLIPENFVKRFKKMRSSKLKRVEEYRNIAKKIEKYL